MAKNKKVLDKTEVAKKIADKTSKISSNFSIFEDYFSRFFRVLSSFIDNFIFSNKYLGFASLLLALLLYFLFGIDEYSIMKNITSSKTINNVNIVTRYNSESFELSGIPSKCDVIVTGDAASVSNSTVNKNGYCLLDLDGYTEGTHFVKVTAFGYGDNVSATANPSNAQITLKRKTTSQFKISYDYINSNQLDSKFILGTPTFNDNVEYVNIRASQDTLNSIALVKALIDVKGQTEDFTVDAPLVAYNSRGQQVEAEIVPNTVKANVKLSSYSKVVPISLKVIGECQPGFAVDSIDMDQQSTTIYGTPDAIDSIENVYVELDLSTVTSNTTIMQPVTLPTGVSTSSITVVNIKVVIDNAVSKLIEGVVLSYINNDNNLSASSVSATTIFVNVTGTEARLADLTADNIKAYIDIKDLTAGTYDLPINLEKKNTSAYFTMSCEPTSVSITLENSN